MNNKTVQITSYYRLTKTGLDCDYAEGYFIFDDEFTFEIYFEDQQNEYTYKDYTEPMKVNNVYP